MRKKEYARHIPLLGERVDLVEGVAAVLPQLRCDFLGVLAVEERRFGNK
jgi:hypothetical protein